MCIGSETVKSNQLNCHQYGSALSGSSLGPFKLVELYEPLLSAPKGTILVDVGGGIGRMIRQVLSGVVEYRKVDGRLDLVDAADGSAALQDIFYGESPTGKLMIQQALELRVAPARPDVRIGGGARGQVAPDAWELQLSD